MNTILTNYFTISLRLTLIRLIVAPLVLPLLLVYLLPLDIILVHAALGILFILFGLTDFFDGYFARRYKQVTPLGAFLDPVADKFFMLAVLMGLLQVHKIHVIWVLLLIGREFFVTSLRAWAAEQEISLPVVSLGKAKTTFQMIYSTFLIMCPFDLHEHYAWVWWFEHSLLVITLALSLGSAYIYYRTFISKAFALHRNVIEV